MGTPRKINKYAQSALHTTLLRGGDSIPLLATPSSLFPANTNQPMWLHSRWSNPGGCKQGEAMWLICYEWEECCAVLDGYRTPIYFKTNNACHARLRQLSDQRVHYFIFPFLLAYRTQRVFLDSMLNSASEKVNGKFTDTSTSRCRQILTGSTRLSKK